MPHPESNVKLFGHIARRDGDSLEKIILQGRVEGSRKPLRPGPVGLTKKKKKKKKKKSLPGSSSLQDLYFQRWRAIVGATSCQS